MPASKRGRVKGKEDLMQPVRGLTEMDSVDRRHITPQRLHGKGCHRIANIPSRKAR